MQYVKMMTWTVEVLDARVRDELDVLPADMRARFRRIVELIQGYERMSEPHVKRLEGPMWEMRMKGKDGISRAIYITAQGRRGGGCSGLCKEDPKNAPGGRLISRCKEPRRYWTNETRYG